MRAVALLSPRILKGLSRVCVVSRALCSQTFDWNNVENGFGGIDDFLNEPWKSSSFEYNVEEKTSNLCGSPCPNGDNDGLYHRSFPLGENSMDAVKSDCERVLEILCLDGPEFDAKHVLCDLGVRVSGPLVRDVLFGILKMINYGNKNRCAKLGYKFFLWSGEQENYMHAISEYHMMMKIFAESEEFKAMWSLVDDMTVKGYPTTARTFNILICTCGRAGLARKVVERFIKSKTFNYRPFKHSYNAILHSLLTVKEYRLIEWVYRTMLVEGHSPDVMTFNILMWTKFRLGKLNQFYRLLDEMGRCGFSPDLHTFNLQLHVLGRGDRPLAALKLLNFMKEAGVDPSVLHFTSLIDGLSRAGNLDACQYFFDEMTKHGCVPDAVCCTVMITGYVVAGEFDKAHGMYQDMITKGQLPNVFTYNSMIRGLCMAKRFEEARLMLKEMESKGCNPNFLVYTTLVNYLRNAGKLSQAHEVIRQMVAKGRYVHLQTKIRRSRRQLKK
ncbi:pentatricopeptide repeat-containing protein-like [Dorcoceras hygrometricum]|uniref:Pentatricopeptide repeat-containing protein-like n=1 Tax=Dorcoceras hygrometricum TaxID=472368 RepID=A0A2Z7CJN0_9LAMI|nr:pentatricopeptide repeat-containing protein-like [Dorcoceras hygrometricum]